jgi:acetyl-CoA carboxylase carboxyltransferase component
MPADSVRLSPRERLEHLCDPGSSEPLSAREREVGVEARRGLVGGRPIVCYAQDATRAAGSVGTAEAEVIVQALRQARDEEVPVVAFLESAGARLQEGAAALGGFGRIFSENVALSELVPQISVVMGTAAGGSCYSPALTDFRVMSDRASMFLTGPKIVKQALGEEVSASDLGGVEVQQRNGVCDLVVGDDLEAVELVRRLLGYLPSNAREAPPRRVPQSAPDGDPGSALPARTRGFYDVRAVIRALADGGDFLEVSRRWARNMVVGFAHVEGHAVGIVANQARHLGGIIDVDASQKGARFVRTCDAFGLPLLVLVDTPGFMPGTRQEAAGVIRHGADLLRAFTAARSRRVTVIMRKAYGGAFITMNSKDIGATASFAWPEAEIGIMGPRAAVEIIHRRELVDSPAPERDASLFAQRYADAHLSAQAALGVDAVDAVIEPSETRGLVADVLFASAASNGSGAVVQAGANGRGAPEGCVA